MWTTATQAHNHQILKGDSLYFEEITSVAGASSSYLSPSSPAGTGPAFSTPYPGMEPARLSFTNTPAPATHAEVIFSAKHNGLCLYLARLLRPMWEPALVAEVPVTTPEGNTVYVSKNI